MIVIRNVFHLKSREAVAVMKEGVAIQKRLAPNASTQWVRQPGDDAHISSQR